MWDSRQRNVDNAMSVYAMNNTGPWYNEWLNDKQDKEWSIFRKNELEERDVTQDRTRLN